MLASLLALSSCLNDDDKETTYYHDTAVTAFTLGTLKYHRVTTLANGKTVAKDTVHAGSSYAFSIDQAKGLIYNPDSLPYGVNASKVTATIVAKNGGVIAVKNVNNDSLKYYRSTDSIDFSQPREIRVFNTDYSAYRSYTVKVNVHRQRADELVWQDHGVQAAFQGQAGLKAVACGDRLFVFTPSGIYRSALTDGKSWTAATPNISLSATAYLNVAAKGGVLYLFDNGTLYTGTDGDTWTAVSTPAITRLLGATTTRLYAYTATGMAVSADNGLTWTADALDTDASRLPVENISFVTMPSLTNDSTDRATLVGNNAAVSTKHGVVWTKYVEYGRYSENQPWSYLASTAADTLQVPYLSQMGVVNYAGRLEALGSDNRFHRSIDGGLTWKTDTTTLVPARLTGVFALAKDSDNWLWIVDAATGRVWKGRHNSQGWRKEQNIFTE